MIESLIYALVIIAIIGVILWAVTSLVPGIPPQVKVVMYAVCGIIMLLVLLGALTGQVELK